MLLATFPDSQILRIPAHLMAPCSHCDLGSPARADQLEVPPLRTAGVTLNPTVPLHQPGLPLVTFHCVGSQSGNGQVASLRTFLEHCNQCARGCRGLSLEPYPTPLEGMSWIC